MGIKNSIEKDFRPKLEIRDPKTDAINSLATAIFYLADSITRLAETQTLLDEEIDDRTFEDIEKPSYLGGGE